MNRDHINVVRMILWPASGISFLSLWDGFKYSMPSPHIWNHAWICIYIIYSYMYTYCRNLSAFICEKLKFIRKQKTRTNWQSAQSAKNQPTCWPGVLAGLQPVQLVRLAWWPALLVCQLAAGQSHGDFGRPARSAKNQPGQSGTWLAGQAIAILAIPPGP